jgi:steroid delta-isomerase-like uncharacterized protein
MDAESSRAIVLRYAEQVWNQRKLEVADELIDTNFKHHDLPLKGPAGIKRDIAGIHSVFPDARWIIEDTIAEENKVALRYRFRGTQAQEFLGISSTGKTVDIAAIAIFRVERSRITEEWAILDFHAMRQQLEKDP